MSEPLSMEEVREMWTKVEERGGTNSFDGSEAITASGMTDLAQEVVTLQSAKEWCEEYSVPSVSWGVPPDAPKAITGWSTDAGAFQSGVPISRKPVDDMQDDLGKMERFDAAATFDSDEWKVDAYDKVNDHEQTHQVLDISGFTMWYSTAWRVSDQSLILGHWDFKSGRIKISGDFRKGVQVNAVIHSQYLQYAGRANEEQHLVSSSDCYFAFDVTPSEDGVFFIDADSIRSMLNEMRVQYSLTNYTDAPEGVNLSAYAVVDSAYALVTSVS